MHYLHEIFLTFNHFDVINNYPCFLYNAKKRQQHDKRQRMLLRLIGSFSMSFFSWRGGIPIINKGMSKRCIHHFTKPRVHRQLFFYRFNVFLFDIARSVTQYASAEFSATHIRPSPRRLLQVTKAILASYVEKSNTCAFCANASGICNTMFQPILADDPRGHFL